MYTTIARAAKVLIAAIAKLRSLLLLALLATIINLFVVFILNEIIFKTLKTNVMLTFITKCNCLFISAFIAFHFK
jgi:hypothetical protein